MDQPFVNDALEPRPNFHPHAESIRSRAVSAAIDISLSWPIFWVAGWLSSMRSRLPTSGEQELSSHAYVPMHMTSSELNDADKAAMGCPLIT